VKRAGVPRIRLHDVRHTHVTLALLDGESPHQVSRRVGHKSVAFTLTRYAHAIPEQQEGAAASFERLVGGREGTS
jgi:integrase